MKYQVEKQIIKECLVHIEGYNEDIDLNLRDLDKAEAFVHVILSMYKPVEVIVNEICRRNSINHNTTHEGITELYKKRNNRRIIQQNVRGYLLELNNVRNLTIHNVLHDYSNSQIYQHTITLFNILRWYYKAYHDLEIPEEIILSKKVAHQLPISGKTKPSRKTIRKFEEAIKNELKRTAEVADWTTGNTKYLKNYVEVMMKNVPIDVEVTLQEHLLGLINGESALGSWKLFTRSILLLGEPGSGKSVAMRNLCLCLLDIKRNFLLNSTPRNYFPIYIPLREWGVIDGESLEQFIFNHLALHKNDIVSFFAKEHFLYLLEKKRFFFLLDGFDEIPAVLSSIQNTRVLDDVSIDIQRFIETRKNRCLISSRKFKCPSTKFYTPQIIYHLKPIDEKTIMSASKWRSRHEVLKRIYNSPNLKGLMKTPLTIAFIDEYLEKKGNALPLDLATLFETIIKSRLALERLKEYNITYNEVIDCAKCIASYSYEDMENEALYGLSKPVNILLQKYSDKKMHHAILALDAFRLARANEEKITFIHRSIHDYFFAKHLQDQTFDLAKQYSINNRQAYILYIELLKSDRKVERIFNFCFKKAQYIVNEKLSYGSEKYKEGLFYLRYLIDGFKTKENLLKNKQNIITAFIFKLLNANTNLIVKKHALEATALLPTWQESTIEKVLKKYHFSYNSYIAKTMIETTKTLSWDDIGNTTKTLVAKHCRAQLGSTWDRSSFSLEWYSKGSPYILKSVNKMYHALLVMNIYPSQQNYTKNFHFKVLVYLLINSLMKLFCIAAIIWIIAAGWILNTFDSSLPQKINGTLGVGFFVAHIYFFVDWPLFRVLFKSLIKASNQTTATFSSDEKKDTFRAQYNDTKLWFKTALSLLFNKRKVITREALEAGFHSFKTTSFRTGYMKIIKSKNIQIDPNSKWPDAKLPNINDDEASGILAEMEENLLKLSNY